MSKRKAIVHRVRLWPYPATDDNAGPIRHAWGCTGCGQHGDGFKDPDAAYLAAKAHTTEAIVLA